MSSIRLVFTAERLGLVSSVVRLWTASRFSHVAIVDGGEVIESSGHADKQGRAPGVRVVPLVEYMTKDVVVFGDIPHPHPDAVIRFCRERVGSRYDWSYFFGLALRIDMHSRDNGRWACSELIAAACESTGHPIVRPDRLHRVTQEHLWMLASGAVKT